MKLPKVSGGMNRCLNMSVSMAANSGITPSGNCVNATIENGKACVDLPMVGKQCMAVPSWVPNGRVASICADICTTWGVPTGGCATVTVSGQQVARECVGQC